MSAALRLAWAGALHQRTRVLLAGLAIVAASCLVVWVVSGYDALTARFDQFADGYLGRYDFVLVPGGRLDEAVDPALIEALRADPDVAEVEPTVTLAPVRDLAVSMRRQGGPRPAAPGGGPGRGRGGPPAPAADTAPLPSGALGQQAVGRLFGWPSLVGIGAAHPPFELREGRWLSGRPLEGVLDRAGLRGAGVGLGDTLVVSSQTGDLAVAIVGVIEGPGADGPDGLPDSALYLSQETLERVVGAPSPPDMLQVRLREGADLVAVRARWSARLAAATPPSRLIALDEVKEGLEQGRAASSARGQAAAATGMALLASLFIIFTTLDMGVSERIRQLALLRAVGLGRRQVAAMIAVEAGLLASIGWAGGLLAGWTLLTIVSHAQPDLFPDGVTLGRRSVLLAGACALGGALLAAIVPAWRAARVDPLAGLTAPAAPQRGWIPRAAALGLALVVLGPVLLFGLPLADELRAGLYLALGAPLLVLGFVLLAPLVVLLVERLLGGPVAALLGIDRLLLSGQLSSHLGRTVGTAITLSVGLGLFATVQVWGYSMLQPFLPGAWAPDALVAVMSGTLPPEEVEAIAALPQVAPGRCVPLAVEQVRLAEDVTGMRTHAMTMTRQDNVIMVGVDPERAFGGSDPLVAAPLVQGSWPEAIARLREGRWCLVPDHFAELSGLALGDAFAVVPPAGGAPVEYRVAGVVTLQGWHWLTKFSGLRRRSARAAALVLAGYEQVRGDFAPSGINYLWLDLARGGDAEALGAALRPIAERHLGARVPVNGQGTWADYAQTFGPSVRITTPQLIGRQISDRSDAVIMGMSVLPLVTLLISALAVVNTMVASIRGRRWELGVLRALGVPRWATFRMVLAEAALVGLVGCCLGLAIGVLAGWSGTGVTNAVGTFGGMDATLTVPWGHLLGGAALAVGLCLLAALIPAALVARREALTLLREGRGAS